MKYPVRLANRADLPALRELIPASVRALSEGYYTPPQVESAIRHVFGPDTQLIDDGTYFAAGAEGHGIVGCGGWSRRRTLYGGDQMKSETPHAVADDLLDPATDAARLRAFFVAPGWERRGIATRLITKCMEAAANAGFRRLELVSTLPGEPLYLRWGFTPELRFDTTLPDGTVIAFVRMSYEFEPAPSVRSFS